MRVAVKLRVSGDGAAAYAAAVECRKTGIGQRITVADPTCIEKCSSGDRDVHIDVRSTSGQVDHCWLRPAVGA